MRYAIEDTEAFRILARRAAAREARPAAEHARAQGPTDSRDAGMGAAWLVGLTLLAACAGAVSALL